MVSGAWAFSRRYFLFNAREFMNILWSMFGFGRLGKVFCLDYQKFPNASKHSLSLKCAIISFSTKNKIKLFQFAKLFRAFLHAEFELSFLRKCEEFQEKSNARNEKVHSKLLSIWQIYSTCDETFKTHWAKFQGENLIKLKSSFVVCQKFTFCVMLWDVDFMNAFVEKSFLTWTRVQLTRQFSPPPSILAMK